MHCRQHLYQGNIALFMFGGSSRRKDGGHMSAVGSCLRLQAVWLWLAVVSLAFQGPRPRLLLHRARAMAYPTPDANKAHHSLPLLFACLPGHTTPPFTTYPHILHCIHYSPRLYTHYTLLAIFLLTAPSTFFKCLQTPRSNHE